jgi:hypothetical protein
MTDLPVEQLLDNHLAHNVDASWYRAPDIPAKKLRNALGKYAGNVPAASVLALGDGTAFGSAKEGVVITDDVLFSHTTEETFSVPLQEIKGAKKLSGWPGYGIELQCRDGDTHRILTTCFEKNQDGLVAFLNSIAENKSVPVASLELSSARQITTFEVGDPQVGETPSQDVFAGLKQLEICQQHGIDDVGAFFNEAFRADSEQPLLKGYCRYVGFNGREVDAVVLLTNRRLLLYSMEMGAKIVFVELTKRLLGKLPVPFIDSIVSFLLFSIPRSIYVALRGGKEQLIAQALSQEESKLLSANPPLRKVHEFDFAQLAQSVAQVDVGTGVSTGFLSRKFGVTFSPVKLAKTFSLPKDLILPEYESLEPIAQLLHAVRSTLATSGLDYRLDADGQKLSIVPAAAELKAAA